MPSREYVPSLRPHPCGCCKRMTTGIVSCAECRAAGCKQKLTDLANFTWTWTPAAKCPGREATPAK